MYERDPRTYDIVHIAERVHATCVSSSAVANLRGISTHFRTLMYEGASSRYCKKLVTARSTRADVVYQVPTHVPRLQREDAGDDVQAVRGNERQHNIAENLVSKDRSSIDALLLHRLDANNGQVDWARVSGTPYSGLGEQVAVLYVLAAKSMYIVSNAKPTMLTV